MFVTTSLLLDFIGFIIAIAVVLVTYYNWSFRYWKSKDVPHDQPTVPFGSFNGCFLHGEHIAKELADYYKKMKNLGHKHCGAYLFSQPIYIPIDPEIVKHIMQKDFEHFTDRGFYVNEKADPLSGHLFLLGGEKWRTLRHKLTPTFTSGKMKMMFQTLVDCGGPLMTEVERLNKNGETLDIKELVANYTTDIIGSCAFGLDCNSFTKDESEFRQNGRLFFETNVRRKLKGLFSMVFPNMALKLNITSTPQSITDFFLKTIKDTVEYRQKNKIVRNDFMHLLIDMLDNKTNAQNAILNLNELSAQAFVFFLAGFETSSTTMTYAMYQLSKNQDMQDRVRKEIKEVLAKYDNKITYDSINDMKYLQQVVDETLRMYPPVPLLNRTCMKDYKVPGTDLLLEKNTKVFIPAYGLQHDPEFYPDPERFDPERFTLENKENIVPFTYVPFGEGPRICIGLRFGMMQSKVGLVTILGNYKLTLNEKTPKNHITFRDAFVLANKETIYLDSQKI